MRVRAARGYLVAAVLCGMSWAGASAGPREDAERTTERLNRQARQLYDDGRYQQVQSLAQRALEISESVLGPDHPQTARSLNTLAHFHLKMGSYAQAEPLYRRVLAMRERGLNPDHPDIAASLNNLALLYAARGDYARAEPLQLRALAIREKVFGPGHPETAKSLTNLGILYADTGAYERAEPLYQRALAIREQQLGPHHPYTAAALCNLASVYYYTGAYVQAEALYLRGLAIYQKALGPEHPDTAASLNNLGEVYRATGAHDQAMRVYEQSLAIREKTLGPKHPATAGSLNNMTGLYRVTGEVAKARPLYERALAITEKVLGPWHPDTAISLNNLANLYLDIGAYDKAELLYARAHAIREKTFGAGHPDVAQSLNNLAILAWARGHSPRALALLQQAQAVQVKNSERLLFSGSEARKQAYIQQLAEDTFVRVSFSVAVPSGAGIELGLSSVLQYKGRVLDTMSDNVARLRRSIKAEDRVLMDRLAQVANQSSTVLYQGLDELSSTSRGQRLMELARRRDALETELARRSSEFRQQTLPVTITSVRHAIPADAVLVEWIRYTPFDATVRSVKAQWGAPRYVAYVLERAGAPAVIDMGDAAVLDKLASDFNRAVSNPKRSDVRQLAVALSDRLIKPLLPQLRGHSRVLLSPDGALNLVSMAALLDEQGHYLAEQFEITYQSSGRDLPRITTAVPHASMQAVVVADPDYGAGPSLARANALRQVQYSSDLNGSGLIFKPLPGTALEAKALQDLFKPHEAEILMRLDATEEQLRHLHGPRLLHIATHGFFLDDRAAASPASGAAVPAPNRNPLLRSGLALAGANARRSGTNDDGILTALEMAQLDLRGTELVVLSACETAIGDVASGEGIYGLRRALVLAGAQTQVTSLWQVSDQATRTLMVNFYRRLLQGAGRSAALRAAQRDMMTNPARSHPYYWAGFVPVGAWGPLRH